jgi:hypothetical protein
VRLVHTSAVLTPTIVPSERLVAKQSTVFPILPAGSRSLSGVEATQVALSLGNRGPLELGPDGRPPSHIVDAFERFGFYVFEGLIQPPELAELQQDMHTVLESATFAKRNGDPTFDHFGVPVTTSSFGFTKPLSDNSGPDGRSPTAMTEYTPPMGAPEEICRGGSYYLRFSRPGVRLYGHPKLLAMAEAVNGPGFTPFSDSIQYKEQGLGPAVAWHQDGTTHWEKHGASAEHGFNFMVREIIATPLSLSQRKPLLLVNISSVPQIFCYRWSIGAAARFDSREWCLGGRRKPSLGSYRHPTAGGGVG